MIGYIVADAILDMIALFLYIMAKLLGWMIKLLALMVLGFFLAIIYLYRRVRDPRPKAEELEDESLPPWLE